MSICQVHLSMSPLMWDPHPSVEYISILIFLFSPFLLPSSPPPIDSAISPPSCSQLPPCTCGTSVAAWTHSRSMRRLPAKGLACLDVAPTVRGQARLLCFASRQLRPMGSVHDGSAGSTRSQPHITPASGASSVAAPIIAPATSPLTVPVVALPAAIAVATLEDIEGERKWEKKLNINIFHKQMGPKCQR